MATDDGATRSGSPGEHRPNPRRGPRHVGKPSELDKDFPWPATWQRNLGPGGDELDDGLVDVGLVSDPTDHRPFASAGWRLRLPRVHLDLRSRAPVVASAAAALVGLSSLGAFVVLSFDGAPPSQPRGEQTPVILAVPEIAGLTSREWAAASRELSARVEAAAERRRDAARDRLQRDRLAEQRRREERERPAPRSPAPAVTTQVAETPRAPAPPADPWPGVSPAERTLTPGPWNLS